MAPTRCFSRPRPQGFYSTSGACSVSPFTTMVRSSFRRRRQDVCGGGFSCAAQLNGPRAEGAPSHAPPRLWLRPRQQGARHSGNPVSAIDRSPAPRSTRPWRRICSRTSGGTDATIASSVWSSEMGEIFGSGNTRDEGDTTSASRRQEHRCARNFPFGRTMGLQHRSIGCRPPTGVRELFPVGPPGGDRMVQ
jgi:hypothetical protein